MPILFDFESPGLSPHWNMTGGGSASREDCAPGWCLRVKAPAGASIASGSVPTDWTGFGELSFRALTAVDTTLDVRVTAGEGRASFWRRVDVRGGAWRDIRLPLGWLRRDDGPTPDWSTVDGVTFTFRDASNVWLDDIALATGSPVLTAEAVAKVTGGTVTGGRHVAVVSLVPSLDAVKLASRLDAVADRVRADLPFLGPLATPVPLVVFPDEASYRAGVAHIGTAFAANAQAPQAGGFTLEGIATSYWDASLGVERPVYVHEFVHALLSRTASLPNRGEWLQEGLATWYQVQPHPQSNLDDVVSGQLARPFPLSRLCDGERIDMSLYADAWTVVGTLLQDPGWAGTLPRLFEAAGRTGSTSLADLGVDLAGLDQDRRVWAQRYFGW